jgi:hypothetical protein
MTMTGEMIHLCSDSTEGVIKKKTFTPEGTNTKKEEEVWYAVDKDFTVEEFKVNVAKLI